MIALKDRKLYLEASKVTLFIMVIVAIAYAIGMSNHFMLFALIMSTMSCVVTFSTNNRALSFFSLGCLVVLSSILSGGMLGYYLHTLAIIILIVYASLTYAMPKADQYKPILINSSIMFIIFSSEPFSWQVGWQYGVGGIIIGILLGSYFWLLGDFKNTTTSNNLENAQQTHSFSKTGCAIMALALLGAWGTTYFFRHHTSYQHTNWISLTVVLVIQGANRQIILTSLKRIIINTIGAAFIILLFHYIVPARFSIEMLILGIFLYLIFIFIKSNLGRILVIELFVLSFSHTMQGTLNTLALDRIIMTLTGGALAIASMLIVRGIRHITPLLIKTKN